MCRGDEVKVFLVGFFELVAEAAVASMVAKIGTAEMSTDAARIVTKTFEHVRVPMAFVADELATGGWVGGGLIFGSISPENRLFGDAVPVIEVGDGLFEVLKGEDIDEGERGFDDFAGERGVGFVAVAEDEVVRVVAFDGGVRDLVVARGELA